MLAEVTDALRSFSPTEVQALERGLGIAVAWESALLANPSAAVWTRVVGANRRESLLPPASAADDG